MLMYDMRGHGESTTGAVPWVSWGAEEGKDVVAAVDFVSKRFPAANIYLLSICMGSSAATFAYGKYGLEKYNNIKAQISVQPLTYTKFIEAFGLPKFLDDLGTADYRTPPPF